MGCASAGRWLLTYLSPATCSVPCQVGTRRYASRDFLDPNLSTLGHLLMIVLWYGLIVAYAALVTYQWAIQPDAKVLTQSGADAFPPVQVYVQAGCTNSPHCGNITVSVNYDASGPCGSLSRPAAPLSPAGQWVTLCPTPLAVLSTFTTGPLAATGVLIDFSSVNPGYNATGTFWYLTAQGIVRVYSDDTSGSAAGGASSSSLLLRAVDMASWQVKSLLIGQSVVVQNNAITASQVFASATQYEGRYPNWRATLVVGLEQYVNVVTVVKKGPQFEVMSIFSLVAGWLGIVFVLRTLFPYTKPCFLRFFPAVKKE